MKTTFENFVLTSKFSGTKPAPWGRTNWNHFIFSAKNTETKKTTRSDYWQSIHKPRVETEKDLGYIFLNIIEEAVAGEMSEEDFTRQYGYTDEVLGRKAWKNCIKVSEKLRRICDEDFEDMFYRLSRHLGE